MALPRDARDQVVKGDLIDFNKRQSLDVAFFANNQGSVTHTGLLISEKEIIHAHGWVRIDAFDENGIFNRDKNKYTHFLHSVRRFL
jgi:cell wall-associated NlpC family hydrolase